jgi:hypothetical protein
MMEEYQSIMKNDVWEVVRRPKENYVITSKWVYKIKHVVDGSIDKYKVRFVARGFSQQEGEDYDETFALVARYTSIRAIISLAASMGWSLHQMDVKNTFLNGVIEEEIKKKEWKEAMMEEYQYIMKNDVWEVVSRPKEKSVVTSKWVYKIKHVVDGSIEKHKARFVACGFS